MIGPASRQLTGAVPALLLGLLLTSGPRLPAAQSLPVNLAFSSELFIDVNENDARAAMKAWGDTLASNYHLNVTPQVQITTTPGVIARGLQEKTIDAAGLTTPEYWTLRDRPLPPDIILGQISGNPVEEYVLLVHRDNPARAWADLQGQRVGYQVGPRASLAAAWLETQLLTENLGPARAFWSGITYSGKLTRLVLPVFFRQLDACLVTLTGFRLMCELNPQVGRQLRILRQSPAYVPALFFFRADYNSVYRDTMSTDVGPIATSPAGRQALLLFQTDGLARYPATMLAASFALLQHHADLLAARAGTDPSPAPAALP